MNNDLLVDPAGLEIAAAQLAGAATSITARLERLDAELGPLKSDWTGSQQEQYLICKAKWDDSAGAMLDLLTRISKGVTASMHDYVAADQRGSQRFGG